MSRSRSPSTGSQVVQSLLFARSRWTVQTATRWASSHGFATDSVDVKPATIRLRQWDPAEGDASTFRTIPLGEGEGIQAVVATRTGGIARAQGDSARSPAAVYDAILTLAERANPALAAWMLPRKEPLIEVIAEVLHEKRMGEAFAAMFPRVAKDHAEVGELLEQSPLDWPRLNAVLEAHAQFEDGVVFPHLRAQGAPDAVLRAAAHATSEHPGIREGARARDPNVRAKILHHFDEEERDLYGPAALAGFGEPAAAQLPRAGAVHYVAGDVFSFVNDTPVTLGPDYAASSDYRRTFTPKDIVYVQRVEPGAYVVRRVNGATMDHYLRYADADREAIDVDVSDALGPAILDLKRREKPWLANAVAAPFERYVRTGDATGLLEARDALGRKGWSTTHEWMAPLLTRGHELALNPRPAPIEIGTLPANEVEATRALRWARDAAIRGRQAGRDVTSLDGWVHALRTYLMAPPPSADAAVELPAAPQPPPSPTPAIPPNVRDIAELGLSADSSPVGDLLRAAEPHIGPIFARLFTEGGLLVQPDGAYMDAAWNLYGGLAVHGWLGRRGLSTKGSSGFITDAWNRWPEAHRPNLPDPFGIPAEDWNRGGRNVGKSEATLEDVLNQQAPDLAPWHVEATRGGALGDWNVAIRSRGPGVSAVHVLGTGDTRVAAMRNGVESRNLHRAVWAHRIGRYFNSPDGKAVGKLIEALAPSSEPATAPPETAPPDVALVPEQFGVPELPQPPRNAATGPSPERQRELIEERERMRAKLGHGTLGAQAQARSRIREINAELAGNADQKAVASWLRARARKGGGAFDADLAEAAFRHMPGWSITPTTTLIYVNANTNDAVRHTLGKGSSYALVAEDYTQKGWWHFEGAEDVQFVKVPGDAKGKPIVDDPVPGTFYVTDGPRDGKWGSTPTKRVKSPAIGVAAWVVKAPNGASTLVTDKPRSPGEPLTADSFWKWAYASATFDRATGATHGATGLDTAAAAALPAAEAAIPLDAVRTAHPHGYDTCSVCFGSHALATNVGVKDAGIDPETGKPWITVMDHGYRRPGWGYNVEPCPGTRYPPYPASPAGTKAYLRGLEAAAAGIPAWIETLKAGAHPNGSRVEVTVKAYSTDPKTGKRVPETDPDRIARYGEWQIEDVRVYKGHKLWPAVQRNLIEQSLARLRSLWGVIPFYRAAVRVWTKGHTGADIREAEEDRRDRPDALLGRASEGSKPAAGGLPESPALPASGSPSAGNDGPASGRLRPLGLVHTDAADIVTVDSDDVRWAWAWPLNGRTYLYGTWSVAAADYGRAIGTGIVEDPAARERARKLAAALRDVIGDLPHDSAARRALHKLTVASQGALKGNAQVLAVIATEHEGGSDFRRVQLGSNADTLKAEEVIALAAVADRVRQGAGAFYLGAVNEMGSFGGDAGEAIRAARARMAGKAHEPSPDAPVAPYQNRRGERLVAESATHALWSVQVGAATQWVIATRDGRLRADPGSGSTGYERKRDAEAAWDALANGPKDAAGAEVGINAAVTLEPPKRHDGLPVPGWPTAASIGSVWKIEDNRGLWYAEVHYTGGKPTTRELTTRLWVVPDDVRFQRGDEQRPKKITVGLGGQQGDYIVADGFRARQTATGGDLGEVIAKALKHYHGVDAEPPTPEQVGALTRHVDTDRKAHISYNPAAGSWSSPPPATPPTPPPALTDVSVPPGWAGREVVWHELDPDAPVGVEGKKTPHRRFAWSKGRVSVFLDWPGTKVSPDRFGVSVLENGHEHVPRGPKLDTFEAARGHAVAVMRGYAGPSGESSTPRDWRRTDSARLDYGEVGAAPGNTRGTHTITASQMEILWDAEGETVAQTRFLIARVKTPTGDRYGILAAWDNPRVGGAPGVAAVGMAEDGTATLRLVRPMDGFEMASAKPEVFGFDTRDDAARFAETLLDQRITTVRALPNRGLWPDGRAVAVPGDKVYRSAQGFGGTAASVGGTVYLKSGAKPVDGELHHVENLRVQDLTVQALIGGGGAGAKTQGYDHNWTLNGDPWVDARARQRAAYEPVAKAKKQAKYDKLAALDREVNARMAAWHAEHGQSARVASLREGDVVEFYKPGVVDDDHVEDVLEQLPVTMIRPATEDDPVADARAGAGTWFRDYVPDDRTISGDWPWRVVSRAAPEAPAPPKLRREPYPWVAAVLERAQAALGVELDTAQALGQGANGQVFAVRGEHA